MQLAVREVASTKSFPASVPPGRGTYLLAQPHFRSALRDFCSLPRWLGHYRPSAKGSELLNRESVRVAVVGAGHWGKNLIRVFHKLGALSAICDLDPNTREQTAQVYRGVPHPRFTRSGACQI